MIRTGPVKYRWAVWTIIFTRSIKGHDEGRITRAEAEELLDCLWLKIAAIFRYGTKRTPRHSAVIPLRRPSRSRNGRVRQRPPPTSCHNMLLETTARVHLPQPSVCVRVSRGTPREFLLKSVEVIREGLGMPRYTTTTLRYPRWWAAAFPRGSACGLRRDRLCGDGRAGKIVAFANSGYFNMLKGAGKYIEQRR